MWQNMGLEWIFFYYYGDMVATLQHGGDMEKIGAWPSLESTVQNKSMLR